MFLTTHGASATCRERSRGGVRHEASPVIRRMADYALFGFAEVIGLSGKIQDDLRQLRWTPSYIHSSSVSKTYSSNSDFGRYWNLLRRSPIGRNAYPTVEP